jgi:hypothetical protein
MPFRYERTSSALSTIPADPFERFVDLYGSFEASRTFFEDKTPFRFAAATLVTTPGPVGEIREAVAEQSEQLAKSFGFWTTIAPGLQVILAAVLHKRGDRAPEFVEGFGPARETFRRHGLRRNEVFELISYTILRGQSHNAQIEDESIARIKQIYLALRGHHYFLTGPEDLPACAALAGTRESPQEIGDGCERVYRALQKQAHWWPGEQLHTASHIMYLSGVAPETITQRAAHMCEQFKAKQYKIRWADYENISLLCMLAIPIDRIVDTVCAAAERIQTELKMWFGKNAAFNLAVSIAFVQLLQGNEDLERISEVKTLLDMQAILAAQQAAG